MSKYVVAAREIHCRYFGGLNCCLHAVKIFFERKNAILTDFLQRLKTFWGGGQMVQNGLLIHLGQACGIPKA